MIRAVAVVLVVVTACKQGESGRDQEVQRMDAFATSMCACKDRACAERVAAEMAAWGKSLAIASKPGDTAMQQVAAIMARYRQCYDALTASAEYAVVRVELPPDAAGELFVDDKYIATVTSGHEISVPAGTRDVAFVSARGRCDARLELVAAKTTKLECTPGPGSSEPPLVLPTPAAPFVVDALLRQIGEHAAARKGGAVPISILVQYVRADGTLDPKYGALHVDTGIPDRPPQDDPDRPIGAPVPVLKPNRSSDLDCPRYALDAATARWTVTRGACGFEGDAGPIRCGMTQIWERARRDGAPGAALAKLALATERSAGWTFQIEDAPRGVHFTKQYSDDCEPLLEKIEGGDVTATGLSRAMIVAAMAPVKDRIRACSARSTARGTVRANVKVSASGTVGKIDISESPDPKLSSCVSTVLHDLVFPATREGGSFSYPFVF